jgi:hypothetical protein
MPGQNNPRSALIISAAVATLAIAGGLYFYFNEAAAPDPPVEKVEIGPNVEIAGYSVKGRKIEAYTYGTGPRHLLFVGGIHGGYEWNSTLLAYRFIDYLEANPQFLNDDIAITIIPSANPDGLFEVVGKEGRFSFADVRADLHEGAGRFNANGVDLNRNFDCKWQSQSTWRSKAVSAGTEPFSEPEARAIRDFVLAHNYEAAVFWHSQANAVYASECEDGILPQTIDIMRAYAEAAQYQAVDSFDAYPITGDAEGWLASIGIPAITVELSTHEDIEWERNLSGFEALLEYYSSLQ